MQLDHRAISPAIATIGLISVAIAAVIPAAMYMQSQARNSVPDTYTVSIDIVKLSNSKAWFRVEQSEARSVCANMLQGTSNFVQLFCTSNRTLVTTANVAVNIGDRYSLRVDLYDAAGKFYAAKNVMAIVR